MGKRLCCNQYLPKHNSRGRRVVKDKKDYINYKLQKAAQSIKEAKLLMENGMNDTAVSRLYYAAF